MPVNVDDMIINRDYDKEVCTFVVKQLGDLKQFLIVNVQHFDLRVYMSP